MKLGLPRERVCLYNLKWYRSLDKTKININGCGMTKRSAQLLYSLDLLIIFLLMQATIQIILIIFMPLSLPAVCCCTVTLLHFDRFLLHACILSSHSQGKMSNTCVRFYRKAREGRGGLACRLHFTSIVVSRVWCRSKQAVLTKLQFHVKCLFCSVFTTLSHFEQQIENEI